MQDAPRSGSSPVKKGYKALLAEAEAEVETLPVGEALALHG